MLETFREHSETPIFDELQQAAMLADSQGRELVRRILSAKEDREETRAYGLPWLRAWRCG